MWDVIFVAAAVIFFAAGILYVPAGHLGFGLQITLWAVACWFQRF